MPDEQPEGADEQPGDDGPEVAAEDPRALAERETALLASLQAVLGDAIVEHGDACGDLVVRVRPDAWRRAGEVARDELECDYLSFISAIDWTPATRPAGDTSGDTSAPVQPPETTFGVAGSTGRFQVFARVASTRRHWGVTLKCDVAEGDPRAESWVPVYPGADWHERECWEMYGIVFDGHPALRHLYLPSGFEGHPLRKDFPLLAREVKPWPGLVDVEAMPDEAGGDDGGEA
ncbi:MAG: NADH-quinone oxidoreductase subunit C [Acidimicrobiia bacterium]|nr:NADH-quinone oxidoreductase subunit C [Acidimicrobiia bacterium]